jgi:hypothetical protein
MRRALTLAAAVAQLVVFGARLGAEVLDRAAVRVGNEIITESALRRHLRLQAFFEQHAPDLRVEARRTAAARLIDQKLVRRELELTRYPPPAESEVDAQVEQIAKARGQDPATFAASLVRYGFTLEELREELRYQIALLRFVDFRFSAGVQVSDAEIAGAYQKEIVAEARKRGVEPAALDDVRAKIEGLLSYRKTTAALEQWLVQARQSVKVIYFEEAFR